jgi:hypothetical protein
MNLDINTTKGQISLSQEEQMLDTLRLAYPDHQFYSTPKQKAAPYDGIIVQDDVIAGIYESKCRNLTRAQLRGYDDQWILTAAKFLKCIERAREIFVPFYAFVYLVPDRTVLVLQITDEHGNILPEYTIEKTETQATCNGGTALRDNAYIDVSTAHEIPIL